MSKILNYFFLIGLIFSINAFSPLFSQEKKGFDESFTQSANSFLKDIENRFEGSEGNYKAVEKIENILKKTDRKWGKVTYDKPVFEAGKAWIEFNGERHQIYSLHPNEVDLGNFSQSNFSAPILYLSNAEKLNIHVEKIKDSLILLDFDSVKTYVNLMTEGALGFIFIAPKKPNFEKSSEKIIHNPISIPRYQIDVEQGERLRDFIKNNQLKSVEMRIEPNKWIKRELNNLWCLIPGSSASLSNEIVIVKANIDTFHYCPELTGGGADSLNLYSAIFILKKYHQSPPARSVLFQFYNSHYQDHSGAAHLVHYTLGDEELFFSKKANLVSEEGLLLTRIAEAESLLKEIEKFHPQNINQEVVDKSINRIIRPAGRNISIANTLTKEIEFSIFLLENEILKMSEEDKNLNSNKIANNREKISTHGKLIDLFKKYKTGISLSSLGTKELQLFEHYRKKTAKRQEILIENSKKYIKRLEQVKYLRDSIKDYNPIFSVGIDLIYQSKSMGFYPATTSWAISQIGNAIAKNTPLVNWLGWKIKSGVLSNNKNIWYGQDVSFLNYELPLNNLNFYREAVPAYSFLNVKASLTKKWSSFDKIESYQKEIVLLNLNTVLEGIDNLVHYDKLRNFIKFPHSKVKKSAAGFWSSRIKDGSSIIAPETILSNAQLVLFKNFRDYQDLSLSSILPYRQYITDENGTTIYHGLHRGGEFQHTRLYFIKDNGKIAYALDRGSSSLKFKYDLSSLPIFQYEYILAGVEVEKADVYELISPFRGKPVEKVTFKGAGKTRLLDYSVSGLATSDMSSSVLPNPMAISIFIPKGDRIKILFDNFFIAGVRKGSRIDDLGVSASDLNKKKLSTLMSKDVKSINDYRVDLLKQNDITSMLLNSLVKKTDSYTRDINPKEIKQSELQYDKKQIIEKKTLGSGYVAYPIIKATINDMIKAVVFYMAIMLPFCFLLQRLLFNFSKIHFQILTFVGIFLLTYLIFHNMHPAFKIAKNPQIIIISFFTMALVLFVSGVLRNKFDHYMSSISGKLVSNETNIRGLAGKAFLLGVSNMKRRKVRTLLTCITIILITFTMLSFTSVSETVSPTIRKKKGDAPYNGIYFSDIVWKPYTQNKIEYLLSIADEGESMIRTMNIASEVFNLEYPSFKKPWKIEALLGLDSREDGWLEKMPMLAGKFFTSSKAQEIIITDKLASSLNINIEDFKPVKLKLIDKEMLLVGIIDSVKLSKIKELRGTSILPQTFVDILGGGLPKDDDAEIPEGNFEDINPLSYVIVPSLASGLELKPVSVSIRYDNAKKTWEKARNLTLLSSIKFYFGCKDSFSLEPKQEESIMQAPGKYFLKSGMKNSFGGLASLLIPLIVAATIIFNTMLSSAYERKKEIFVYNAIGLNPIHIAFFFLAESVVYGLIGSVAGYLCGQIFAKIIIFFDFFKDLSINYSSTEVVYVIFFTILIVIIASLYPTYIAFKTASQSTKKRKLVIEDDGNTIRVTYPFSYTPNMAIAIHAYLREYLDLHVDASIGGFVAKAINDVKVTDQNQNQVIEYSYSINLAPFDLGVHQNVAFKTVFNETVGAHMIEIICMRKAGQDVNWLATNRVFTNRLRKILLKWRALDANKQDEYFLSGKQQLIGSPA